MTKKIGRFITWTPRVLSILLICFIAMFSLDVISPQTSIGQVIIGLLMHNIPVFILLIVLIISWKREIVGGIVFLLAGLFYIFMLALQGKPWNIILSWSLLIAGPAFLIGILFLISWFKKKQY